MSSPKDIGPGAADNLGVDYVICYTPKDTGKSAAQQEFQELAQALSRVGLETEVRNGDNGGLLVFVKASDDLRFANSVYRLRVQDWLYGVRAAQPDREAHQSLSSEPLTDAERLRVVHHLITRPAADGGAGITPQVGKWKNVDSLFALHDHQFNKQWIKKWSTTTFLSPEDLDEIRNKFGEKVGFYFAFTQSYFAFLIFPAAFGLSASLLLGHFSAVYAVVNILWCVTFVEYWRHQEVDLGVRWGVRGVNAIQEQRQSFQPTKQIQDPVTGQTKHTFPASKRLLWQALQVPFALLAATVLGGLIATCFAIEIFISEVYSGPFKSVLVFLPTVLLTTLLPTLSSVLTTVATKLNDLENHETTEAYDNAMTSKLFVLNFITSYLGIILTAFVYLPFGNLLVPYLDVFNLTNQTNAHLDSPKSANPSAKALKPKTGFEINPDRLRKQVIYFTVTAQIVNFATEVVVPYVKRRGLEKVHDIKNERAARAGGAVPSAGANDREEESAFLKRVRREATLDTYDVTTDLREMVVQFGYLALFSVVWPPTAVSFIINNWIELRSDAVKICTEMRRPSPFRADSIGSWLDSLGFLTWLGSVTAAALVYMFSNDGIGPDGSPFALKGWALLLSIFFSEHVYLVVRLVVRFAIGSVYSPGAEREKAERLAVRRKFLEEKYGKDALETLPPAEAAKVEQISRKSLEEDARQGSLSSSGAADRFWGRQRGWQETAQIGVGLLDRALDAEGKKQQ